MTDGMAQLRAGGQVYAIDVPVNDPESDAAARINDAFNRGSLSGGCSVFLPAGTYWCRQSIVVPSGCTLQGSGPGTVLRAAPGLAGPVVTNASGAGQVQAVDLVVNGSGGTGPGVLLSGTSGAELRAVTATGCGTHGIALVNAVRSLLSGCRAYDNSRVAAVGTADGINLSGTSTDNVIVGAVCYDSAGASGRQGYGVREAAASGCDRNLIAGGSLTGNAVGAVSLIGATSKRVDDATVVSDAAPGTATFGDAPSAGVSPLAARADHRHGMPATIPDGSVTTAKIANGAVTAAKLASDVARANLLVNGGFEIWQRGAGPFTAAAAYTADRWQISDTLGTSTISASKDTTNQDAGSAACLAATFTKGDTNVSIQQKLEELAQVKTRTISLGVRVKASVANGARAWISTDGGTTKTYSGYHSGGGTYETLKVENVTVPSGATAVLVGVELAASGTYYLDNAMLVVGPVPADYVPLHPAEEWERCQRYYYVFAPPPGDLVAGYQAAGLSITLPFSFPVQMATTPTMTKSGTWAVNNSGQPVVDKPHLMGFRLYGVAAAAGAMSFGPDSADDTITAEANP